MPPALAHDVGAWVTHHAAIRPDALAWADDHRRCDFTTAADRIECLAGWLAARGVRAGDRIAVWLGNRGATLEALFAAARLGAIMLPVNARLTSEEVAFQLDDCRPSVLLVEHAWMGEARAATENAALRYAACDQVADDGGSWDAAWLLGMQEAPDWRLALFGSG